MTRKSYEFIAAVIKQLPADIRPKVAKAFCTALRNAYANFDWSKFISAATYPHENVWK